MLSTQFIRYFYKKIIIKTRYKNTKTLLFLIFTFSVINSPVFSQVVPQKSTENPDIKINDTIIDPLKESLNVIPKDTLMLLSLAGNPDMMKMGSYLYQSIYTKVINTASAIYLLKEILYSAKIYFFTSLSLKKMRSLTGKSLMKN